MTRPWQGEAAAYGLAAAGAGLALWLTLPLALLIGPVVTLSILSQRFPALHVSPAVYGVGLMAIGGDATASAPQSTEVVGWACGRNRLLSAEPPTCTAQKPLALHVFFVARAVTLAAALPGRLVALGASGGETVAAR